LVRIFSILVHGVFTSHVELLHAAPPLRGFYTTRWVLARNEAEATERAFRSVRRELNGKWPDLRDGLVSVSMNADEIGPGSLWRWLRGGGAGFAFYADE
jgi:hypothetical protein